MKGLIIGLSCSVLGVSTAPDRCNTYYMDSCLVSAFNIPNLCFLVLSFHYHGDSGWSSDVWDCGHASGTRRGREMNSFMDKDLWRTIMINTFTESFSCCC